LEVEVVTTPIQRSTDRVPPEAGFISHAKAPRGPNGRILCRWCGKECPKKNQTFCGPDCVHEWKLRTQPAYQARHVLERDKGVCESCGLDCVALFMELLQLRRDDRRARYGERGAVANIPLPSDDQLPRFGARVRELGLPPHLADLTRRLWEMDHRVPVVEGGGSCGLENLRTLCWACHRRVTAELAKRRARARKQSEPLPLLERLRGQEDEHAL
jgi:5-methylcytosine-specific restriction enzyme A